jgi:hypothetical protein
VTVDRDPDRGSGRRGLKRGQVGGTLQAMRFRVVAACLAFSGIAYAQPGATPPSAPPDPYGPQLPPGARKPAPAPVAPVGPSPAPPGDAPVLPTPNPDNDPVLAEQIAQSLVHRAQELFDARVYVDAKQLAVEALVKSPKGAAAEHAKYLIKKINDQLGIDDTVPANPEGVDLTPFSDRKPLPKELPPAAELPRASRLSTSVHAGLYLGLIGTTVGAFFSDESPARGAVPAGLATGAAGAVFVPPLIDKLKWNEAQIRTAGSGSVWGGVIGGLFGDIAKKRNTTSREVLVGASVGATAGGVAGALLARDNNYTPGDIALVDTFAGMGAVGGLTLGMLMQPVETEAYAVNSALGAAGGIVVGLIAAPQTNTTPRRMARVAAAAAIGGAAPFLLYAGIHDGSATGDERAVGALSSIGLVAGAYVGFRMTRGMDADQDRSPRKKSDEDAPPSLIGRSSSGAWQLGAPAIAPLSRQLAPQPGMAMSLLGGTF